MTPSRDLRKEERTHINNAMDHHLSCNNVPFQPFHSKRPFWFDLVCRALIRFWELNNVQGRAFNQNGALISTQITAQTTNQNFYFVLVTSNNELLRRNCSQINTKLNMVFWVLNGKGIRQVANGVRKGHLPQQGRIFQKIKTPSKSAGRTHLFNGGRVGSTV